MGRPSQQMEAVPEHVERDTTAPESVTAVVDAPSEPLKDAADRVDWLKALVLAAVGIFVAGATGAALMARMATKSDLERYAAKQALLPPDVRLSARVDAIDGRLNEHVARHEGDMGWVKDALRRLLDDRRIQAPPENPTIGPPR